MIGKLRHQKSLKKVKKCKKVKVKAFFPSVVKQAKIAFLTWPTAQMSRSSLIEPVPSSFFGNISSAIFLSEMLRKMLRKRAKKNCLGSKQKKKEGKKSLEDLAVSVSPVIRKARCQTSKDWSPMTAKLKLFEPETVVDIQRKENWVPSSLFIEESKLECWEKRKEKVTENCIENTDFACAATSRPGHMPRQLPARLSGIRSIEKEVLTNKVPQLFVNTTPTEPYFLAARKWFNRLNSDRSIV